VTPPPPARHGRKRCAYSARSITPTATGSPPNSSPTEASHPATLPRQHQGRSSNGRLSKRFGETEHKGGPVISLLSPKIRPLGVPTS
jgi:hypothetical protein